MSESGFLEDGFKDLHAQREKLKKEAAAKRAQGLTQVKALDPMDGNKLKTIWVKKDDPTIAWEAEQAKKKELQRRAQEVERKKKLLEMMQFEADMKEKEKELDKLEKELHKAGIKAIEVKESSKP